MRELAQISFMREILWSMLLKKLQHLLHPILVRGLIGVLANILLPNGCVVVIGQLYSIRYKGIFGMPNKVRRYTCEEARPSRLDFQREEVKIHHIIASMQDCCS